MRSSCVLIRFLVAILQVAKMSGTGAQLYTAISSNTPSTATMLKANRLFVDYSPYIKVSHFFSTKSILDAFEGAERVHLVDYGVDYGLQWPCLIQRLSQRKEGPPHLRITCKFDYLRLLQFICILICPAIMLILEVH